MLNGTAEITGPQPVPPGISARSARDDAWYAIWTRSHCERLVARQLAAKGFAPFLPEISVWSKRDRDARLVREPMFPGYLFLRQAMDKHCYLAVLKVRGIVRILEDGWTRLTPIPDAEVSAIQRVVDANVPAYRHAHVAEGDRVRLVNGPLSGLEGFFIQDKPHKGRVVLSVNLLGRSIAVEVDGTGVTSCADHRKN